MIGRTISGRYEILEHLGSGGFCETYLAQDRQLPDFPRCVVKKLQLVHHHTEAIATAKRLFDTEAKVLYELSQACRQVPRLLAHFQEDNPAGEPEFYLVQEFVAGHDLSYELLPGQPFTEEKTTALLKDILNVLAHVHERGVIHQDIKPRNLIRREEDQKIVLLDFGAVKQITRQLIYPATPNFASSTISIGTPAYMANEQQGGKPRLSSDIYAVGMICIQALTGLHPGQLQEDFDTGEILWRDHAPAVTPRLAAILNRMVRSHFRDRYQSAQEVLADLQPAIASAVRTESAPSLSNLIPLNGRLIAESNGAESNGAESDGAESDGAKSDGATNGDQAARIVAAQESQSFKQSSSPIPSIIPFPTPPAPVDQSSDQPLQIPAIIEFLPEASQLQTNSSVNSKTNTPANSKLNSKLSTVTSDVPSHQPVRTNRRTARRRPWLWLLPLLLGGIGLGYWRSQMQTAIAPPMPAEQFKLASTLAVHKGPVFAVVVSPDGKTFISASGDRTLRKWSMETAELLHTFGGSEKGAKKDGHQKEVAIAAISPDGKTLVSGGRDNVVKVWNYQSGKLLHTLVGHTDWIRAVAISPDNQLVASAGVDHDIRIWDLASGDLLQTIKGHSSEVEGLIITPDGKTLISGSEDETIKLWELNSGKLIRTIPGNGEEVEFIALAPDGKTLVGGGEDRTYIWDITDGDLLRALPEESGIMRTVMVAPDDQTLIGSYQDNTLKLWNLRTGKLLKTLPGHQDWVLYTAVSPDGKTIISGSRDKTIKIWKTAL